MVDDIGQIRHRILWLKQALREAHSQFEKEQAEILIQELESYLAMLEARRHQPVTTKAPE